MNFHAFVWIEKDGMMVLNEAGARTLRAIHDLGNMEEAAKSLEKSVGEINELLDCVAQALGQPVADAEAKLTEAGKKLLEDYEHRRQLVSDTLYRGKWKSPALTVDAIVVKDNGLLLVRRGKEPFKGKHALPGGFVEYGESVERAVVREVREETGLETRIVELHGVYSDPDRDPRGHTVSAVFVCEVTGGELKAGDDAARAEFVPLDKVPELAFDHEKIMADFRDRKN
jgi:8-oxo-dGTP diphosphatase